ncbi:YheT family hydrolase [Rhodocaloribacter sp.]
MPLLTPSDYRPPFWLRNAHAQTIYGGRLRRVAGPAYTRERIDTPDGDFLDLDWAKGGARRVAVLSHGLEGSSDRVYVRAMARALLRAGWDVLAWNYRGCSGEPNRLLRAYHSGETGDLDLVVRHALDRHGYAALALVGFSLGGNLTLKYLGERGETLDPRIRRAVAFSAPVDLAAGAVELAKPTRRVYMNYFRRSLLAKAREKAVRFPGAFDLARLEAARTFFAFDDAFTAPVHGFRDAADYYRQCSANRYLSGIRIPALLVNAADDPFLGPACYPVEAARAHPFFHFEVPEHGGHVAFVRRNGDGTHWAEARAVAFLEAAG